MSLDQLTLDILSRFQKDVEEMPENATIVDIRESTRALFLDYAGPLETNCQVKDKHIPSPAGTIPIRLYYPPKSESPKPVVVFFHGGGWSLADVEAYDSFMRDMCVRSDSIMASVEYRLAPEHKYPAGLNDALAVTNWVLENADTVGGDTKRVGVMGDSAGGNLAAVVAQRNLTQGSKRIAAQFLIYPVLDVSNSHEHYPSRMALGNGEYLLSRAGIDAANVRYLDDMNAVHTVDISPAMAKDLQGLPPATILAGDHDPLLDEARIYAERLSQANVVADFKCFEKAIHAFISFGDLAVANEARTYLAEQIQLHLG